MADYVVNRLITELVVRDNMSAPIRNIQAQTGGLESALNNLGHSIIQGLGIGSGIEIFHKLEESIRAVGDAAKDIIGDMVEFGNHTFKLASITGMTAEQSSQLITVFERYDISFPKVSTGLAFLGKNLQQVANDFADGRVSTGNFVDGMNNMGVAMLDVNGKARDHFSVLMDLADAFEKSTSAQEKDQAATAAFFRFFGKELIPVLSIGSAGIKQLMRDAQEMGYYLSGENVMQVRQAVLAQKELNVAVQGLRLQFGTQFLPMVAEAVTAVSVLAQTINRDVMPSIGGLGKSLEGAAGFFTNLVTTAYFAVRAISDLTQTNKEYSMIAAFENGRNPLDFFDTLGKRLREDINDAVKLKRDIQDAMAAGRGLALSDDPMEHDETAAKAKLYADLLYQAEGFEIRVKKLAVDSIREVDEVKRDFYAKWAEDQRRLIETLGEQNRLEVRDEENTAYQIGQIRQTLYNTIAEKRYQLDKEIATAIRQEADKEEGFAARFRSIAFGMSEDGIKAAQDYAKVNQSVSDQIAEVQYQLGLKLTAIAQDAAEAAGKFQDQRLKATEAANKAVEDAQKRHNDAMAILMAKYNDIGTEGTVDNLKARYALLVQMRDEQRKGQQDVSNAKSSSQATLATKLKEIADSEAAEKASRDRKDALDRAAAAHSIELINHKATLERAALADSMAANSRRIDFDIAEENRKVVAARADLVLKLADERANVEHEIELSKKAADAQIADSIRSEKQQYDDYVSQRTRAINDYNATIIESKTKADQKITDIQRTSQEQLDAFTRELTKFKQDNPEWIAEYQKRLDKANELKQVVEDTIAALINPAFQKYFSDYDYNVHKPGFLGDATAGPPPTIGAGGLRGTGAGITINGDVHVYSDNLDQMSSELEKVGMAAGTAARIGAMVGVGMAG